MSTHLALASNATDGLNTGDRSAVNSTSRAAGTALLEVGLRKTKIEHRGQPRFPVGGRNRERVATHGNINALESGLGARDGAGGVGGGADRRAAGEGAASANGGGNGRNSADVVGADKVTGTSLWNRGRAGSAAAALGRKGTRAEQLTKSGSVEQSSPRAKRVSQLPVPALQYWLSLWTS